MKPPASAALVVKFAPMAQNSMRSLWRAQELAERQAEKSFAVDPDIGGVVAVVVQIAADLRRVGDDFDAKACEVFCRTNSGKHQELRRPEGAAAQHDFSASRETAFAAGRFAHGRHGPPTLEHDLLRPASGEDGKVGWGVGEIGARRVVTFAVALEKLIRPDAFLTRAVEVGIARKSRLYGGLDEGLDGGVVIGQVVDLEGAAFPVEIIVAADIVFAALEVGQHVRKAPARATRRRPNHRSLAADRVRKSSR